MSLSRHSPTSSLLLYFFHRLDRLLQRRHKGLRLSEGALRQLKFTYQYPISIDQE